MCKRFSERPSVILKVDEPYAAYCIDEACTYALCRIEETGRIPPAFEKCSAVSCSELAGRFKNMKGVDFIDHRGNNSRVSDA